MIIIFGVVFMAVHFVVSCLIVGFVLWLINTYLPIDAKVKQVMNIGAVILLILELILEIANIV